MGCDAAGAGNQTERLASLQLHVCSCVRELDVQLADPPSHEFSYSC